MIATLSEGSIRASLSRLYRSWGYLPFKVNKFEEYDFYAQYKSFLACKQVLTFNNIDGRLMALKPDVTLSILKSASNSSDSIHKVYYNENVFRVPENGDGFQEIDQTGLECIGKIGLYELAEVVMLSVKSLNLLSESYILSLSHVGIVSGILENAGLSPEIQADFFEAMGSKNIHELRALCTRYTLAESVCSVLTSLTNIYGPVSEKLSELEALDLPSESQASLEELAAISKLLTAFGVSHIYLDFSVVNDIEYYNGIVFSGYIDGIAAPVLSGGQYDRLMEQMNRSGGAIGFAVYTDRLEALMAPSQNYDVDILIVCPDSSDLPLAISVASGRISEEKTVCIQTREPDDMRWSEKIVIRNGEVQNDGFHG